MASTSWKNYLASIGGREADVLVDVLDPSSNVGPGFFIDAAKLAEAEPASGSEAASLASRLDPSEIITARAMGAEWLDDWCADLRSVELEISGDDLLAEGVPAGPMVGIGLNAALRAKLDGEEGGRSMELQIALDACRSSEGQVE